MTIVRTVSWFLVVAALGVLTVINPTQPGGPMLRDVSIAAIPNPVGGLVR